MRQELCLSSPKSSFLPSSLQRWAEADSLLHRVCGRDSTFQPLPLCLALTKDQLNLALTVGRLRRCADSVCDALTRQGTIQMMHPSARPVYPRPHRTTPRNRAAPAHAVPFPLPAVPKRPLGPLSSVSSVPTLLRFAALPHACSGCACLPDVKHVITTM